MPTDAQLLTLAQWFSPAYPVGAFSYSHGLEGAVDAGDVTTASDLRCWIETVLRHGAGRADALFLAAAYRGEDPAEIPLLDAKCRAFAASAERLSETTRQGAAFAKVTTEVTGAELPELTYPVAVGYAAKLCDLPLQTTSVMYLHSFASNLVGAGQRLAAIGQSQAQSMINTLAPLCGEIAAATQSGDLERLSNTAFLSDIAAMKHETQYSRMFQT